MSRHLNSLASVLKVGRRPRHAIRLGIVLGFGLLASACAAGEPAAPFDVGNMALPTPLPQGSIATTNVGGRTFDTGNMAFPNPVPQGNLITTRVQ